MDLFFDISEKRSTFALAKAKRQVRLQRARKQFALKPKQAGCSSVRLEYTSGGREVAGSNPVTPTSSKTRFERAAFLCFVVFVLAFYCAKTKLSSSYLFKLG
jgi:hypothetical protein